MKNHYLHLVKLGISLKYIKKNQVDELLKGEKVSFQILESKLKKEQWVSLWHIHIEKLLMATFVKHGLLDKKLFLVIMDDLMIKAKQKKSIVGPMIAVQKNLLGQKIVERAYNGIILKKMKLPKNVHDSLLQEGFITGDRKLFMLGFDTIEEVEPIPTQNEPKVERFEDKPTVFADESSHEETETIRYNDEEMFENVSTTGKTKVMYEKENPNYTEEVCRDIAGTDEVLYSTKNNLAVIVTQVSTILIIAAALMYSYFFWRDNTYNKKIAEAQKILQSIEQQENWETIKSKYWMALNIYNYIIQKKYIVPNVYTSKLICLESFLNDALEKRLWYLANAIKNDYYITSTISRDQECMSQESFQENNQRLSQKFDDAIKNSKTN